MKNFPFTATINGVTIYCKTKERLDYNLAIVKNTKSKDAELLSLLLQDLGGPNNHKPN